VEASDQGHDIVVVGASAGGVEALVDVVSRLPVDLPAAVFVVLHVAPSATSLLPEILSRKGPLPAAHPSNNDAIRGGHLWVAPPDCHLLVKPGRMQLTRGPRENGYRPAVDVLFRSAALAYGPRVIGVVLSGALDDGAAGLLDIREAGGIGIAQDPSDAVYPSMPESAIAYAAPDYVLPAAEIGDLLGRLVAESAGDVWATFDPKEMEMEVEPAELNPNGAPIPPGEPSNLTCPECKGALWQIVDGDVVRFRCRVGHAYSVDSLVSEQARSIEAALWSAVRELEERADLSRRLAERFASRRSATLPRRYERQASEAQQHAAVLREVLASMRAPVEAQAPESGD
jgi:two-component system chemotaxis response regulator CheB